MWGGEDFSILKGGKGNDELFDAYGGDLMFGGPGDDAFNIIGRRSDIDTGLSLRTDFPRLDGTTGTLPIMVGSTPTSGDVTNTRIGDFEGGDRIVFETVDESCTPFA